ncbi:MAG: carbon dioxide concentrating mechanism protein CcmL [Planctomycetia bacterium]|nr:carbon dioxide concentrating mechanism protein CcmL [Planctomycetia bacterium]
MRIAEVIGTVTLSRVHPSLIGSRWLVVVPFSLRGLKDEQADGEELIAYDESGAAPGLKVALGEGGEAAAPFLPNKKPVDAYCAAILDRIMITE